MSILSYEEINTTTVTVGWHFPTHETLQKGYPLPLPLTETDHVWMGEEVGENTWRRSTSLQYTDNPSFNIVTEKTIMGLFPLIWFDCYCCRYHCFTVMSWW